MAGLEVEKLYSLDRRHVLLKIRLPRSKLEEVSKRRGAFGNARSWRGMSSVKFVMCASTVPNFYDVPI